MAVSRDTLYPFRVFCRTTVPRWRTVSDIQIYFFSEGNNSSNPSIAIASPSLNPI